MNSIPLLALTAGAGVVTGILIAVSLCTSQIHRMDSDLEELSIILSQALKRDKLLSRTTRSSLVKALRVIHLIRSELDPLEERR